MRAVLLVLFSLFIFLSPPLHAADKVRLQLLWKHQFQFAGYYMAQQKGFYAEEGLEVELLEFGEGPDPLTAVSSGQAEFGVGRSGLLIDSVQGQDVLALFAAFQQSPLMLLTTESSGIKDPADLRDKNIMITNEAKRVGELLAMLLQAGITSEGYRQQKHSYNIQDLINGNTDAMASYVSNEPYALEQQGIAYNILHPKNHGFDMYSDILFTNRSFALRNPELTERFYRASIRGWLYAFEHIMETAEVITQHYNSQNKSFDALVFEGRELRKLAFDERGEFGTLSRSKFNQMAQVYLITNSIERDYNFDDFIYTPRSNRLRFTQDELAYLSYARPLNACINPDWYPYESYQGERHQGMIADYLQLVMNDIGLRYSIVPSKTWRETLMLARSGRCDIVAGAMQTIQRSNYLEFSRPYLSIPAVVAALPENRNQSLRTKRIAVKDKSAFHDILFNRFPAAELVPVSDTAQAFHMILNGEIDALVGAEASLVHKLRQHQISGISISDQLNDNWDISIAVTQQSPVLLNVINKAIAAIPEEKHGQILQRWFKVDFTTTVDYSLVWQLLGGIAVLAGFALYRYLDIVRYNKKLRRVAERDGLTGILSRRKVRQELEGFLELSDRHGWNLSLIFFDIDDFKKINDSLGHALGDRVLVDVARLVEDNTRKSDRFGRWGGEEFLFVMLECDLEQARMTAEKIRADVAEHDFHIGGRVSCSFGVAQYQLGETIESLVGRADEAMYEAKAQGKNCVRALSVKEQEEMDQAL